MLHLEHDLLDGEIHFFFRIEAAQPKADAAASQVIGHPKRLERWLE